MIPAHAGGSYIGNVYTGCSTALADNNNSGCCLTTQARGEFLADINSTAGTADGIIYIGAVLAMMFLPYGNLNQHAPGIGIPDDAPDIFSGKFAAFGDFATEVLLALIEKQHAAA
jgi:hypothetical protein